MSGLPLKADMLSASIDVRFGSLADISERITDVRFTPQERTLPTDCTNVR